MYASTHAAVQAVAAGAVAVLQQLAVPGGGLLDQEGVCHSPIVTGVCADTDVCYGTPTDISAMLGKGVSAVQWHLRPSLLKQLPWATGLIEDVALLCVCRLVE